MSDTGHDAHHDRPFGGAPHDCADDSSYGTAVNEALERLGHAGFFLGTGTQLRGFALHAPMGAEALAALGHGDQVPDWVEWYAAHRGLGAPPDLFAPIDAVDPSSWRAALGEARRLADWATLFRHEIDAEGWRATLATWWPRLTPGMFAGLTHGVIRTAHAVRGITAVSAPSTAQLHELANGLAFWAALYQPANGAAARGARAVGAVRTLGRQRGSTLFAAADALLETSVDAALAELTATGAARYTLVRPGGNPVPAIHAVTAPAAVRMTLPHLPPHLALPSYEAVRDVSGTLLNIFTGRGAPDPGPLSVDAHDPAVRRRIVESAVDLRDEHAIKIAEAALREYADHADPRCFAAARHAVRLLGG
ncbi:hypothetical protein ABZ901_24940 [Actinacidiphila alni]|uniref:hypothetical protein n=1 Tax=Actinacidiphila alni TaxID=380248 RepID=UPI00340C818A